MATLAMLVAARGLAELLSNKYDADRHRAAASSSSSAATSSASRGSIWIFVIAAVGRVVPARPHDLRSPHGRHRRQLRGDAPRRHPGEAPPRRRCTCSSASAPESLRVMMLGRTTAGTSTHGTLYELDAIAAVVVGGTLLVGGRGTIVGTVLGVLIFSTLTNVFTQNNLSHVGAGRRRRASSSSSRCCCSSGSRAAPAARVSATTTAPAPRRSMIVGAQSLRGGSTNRRMLRAPMPAGHGTRFTPGLGGARFQLRELEFSGWSFLEEGCRSVLGRALRVRPRTRLTRCSTSCAFGRLRSS